MFLGLKWPTQLAGVIRNELQNLIASINAWSNVEHNDDGSHRDVTADSVTVAHDGQFGDNLVVLTRGGTAPRTPVAQGDNLAIGFVETPGAPNLYGIGLRWPQSPAGGWDANAGAWFLVAQDYSQIGGSGVVKDLAIGHKDATNGAIVRLLKHVATHGYWALVPDRDTNILDGVSLGAPFTGHQFREIHGFDVYALFGYYERGRTTRMGEWEAYTPVWTNLTLGNATSAGSFTRVGKTVFYKIRLVWGSTTSASGVMSVSLPTASAAVGMAVAQAGHVWVLDASSNQRFTGQPRLTDTSTIELWANTAPNQSLRMSSTVPFTWAQGDQMFITGWYEEA